MANYRCDNCGHRWGESRSCGSCHEPNGKVVCVDEERKDELEEKLANTTREKKKLQAELQEKNRMLTHWQDKANGLSKQLEKSEATLTQVQNDLNKYLD